MDDDPKDDAAGDIVPGDDVPGKKGELPEDPHSENEADGYLAGRNERAANHDQQTDAGLQPDIHSADNSTEDKPAKSPELAPLPEDVTRFQNSAYVQKPEKHDPRPRTGKALIVILVALVFALAGGVMFSAATVIASFFALVTSLAALALLAIWTVFGPGKLLTRLAHMTLALIALGTVAIAAGLMVGGRPTFFDYMATLSTAYMFWIFALIPAAFFRIAFGWRMHDTTGRIDTRPLSIADLMVATVIVAIAAAILQSLFQPSLLDSDWSDQFAPFRITFVGVFLAIVIMVFGMFIVPSVGLVMSAKDNATGFVYLLVYGIVSGLLLFTVFCVLGMSEIDGIIGWPLLVTTVLMVYFLGPMLLLKNTGLVLYTRWTATKAATLQQPRLTDKQTYPPVKPPVE